MELIKNHALIFLFSVQLTTRDASVDPKAEMKM